MADPACRSPVALFLFNRPASTRRVIDAIAAARPERLLVVADGPRPDRPGEADLCRAARAVVEEVGWPCTIQRHYADANLGCRRRIASGLDWVFSQVDRAIILEDDCVPAPAFFPFCDELLERHAGDPRVHMIRGTSFLGDLPVTDASYYFSQFCNIWGWATWARAWAHYDVDMKAWPGLRAQGWLERRLPDPEQARLVRHFFDETHAGRIDTWDYQWTLAGWLHDGLAAVPAVNLVTNIGHGAGATHTHEADSHLAGLAPGELAFPLRHPPAVERLAAADDLEWRRVYPPARPERWWRRAWRKAFGA